MEQSSENTTVILSNIKELQEVKIVKLDFKADLNAVEKALLKFEFLGCKMGMLFKHRYCFVYEISVVCLPKWGVYKHVTSHVTAFAPVLYTLKRKIQYLYFGNVHLFNPLVSKTYIITLTCERLIKNNNNK